MDKIASNKTAIKKNYNNVKSKVATRASPPSTAGPRRSPSSISANSAISSPNVGRQSPSVSKVLNGKIPNYAAATKSSAAAAAAAVAASSAAPQPKDIGSSSSEAVQQSSAGAASAHAKRLLQDANQR